LAPLAPGSSLEYSCRISTQARIFLLTEIYCAWGVRNCLAVKCPLRLLRIRPVSRRTAAKLGNPGRYCGCPYLPRHFPTADRNCRPDTGHTALSQLAGFSVQIMGQIEEGELPPQRLRRHRTCCVLEMRLRRTGPLQLGDTIPDIRIQKIAQICFFWSQSPILCLTGRMLPPNSDRRLQINRRFAAVHIGRAVFSNKFPRLLSTLLICR